MMVLILYIPVEIMLKFILLALTFIKGYVSLRVPQHLTFLESIMFMIDRVKLSSQLDMM